MDGIQTSEIPEVSTGTADSPSALADSSVSTEANQTATPTTETPSVPTEVNGQSSAATQDQFPDDDALAAMPGEERKTHWQQVRSRIDELNRQLAERDAQSQQAQLRPQEDESNWVRPDLLFAPKLDPRTGEPFVDPTTGDPITTSAPFLERLRAESPSTFGELVFESMAQPWNDRETTDQVLFREYYGLKPELIETYRQIQSAEDAQAYIPAPVDMEHIPQQYQDLYRSLDAETRDQIDSIYDDPARSLALRGLNAEFQQKQMDARRDQEIATERQQAQQQRAIALGNEISNGTRALVRQQFEKSAQLTGEPEVDKMLWDVLMTYGEAQLLSDPQGKTVVARLYGDNGLINKGEAHLAKSQQALLAANAARLMKQPLESLSAIASDARKWRDHQRQNAAPRAEIGGNGSTGSGQQSVNNNGLQQQSNGRASLFNADEVAQLAAQIKAVAGG